MQSFNRIKFLLGAFLLYTVPAFSQFYLKGVVVNEKKEPIPNAKIFSHKLKLNYYSGNGDGTFGISLRIQYDTFTLSHEGYETATFPVDANVWQNFVLKEIPEPKKVEVKKRISVLENYNWQDVVKNEVNEETYLKLIENPPVSPQKNPISGVSLSLNKASYSNVRRFLNSDMPVPENAVRVEELINYYNLLYETPQSDSVFKVKTLLSNCPWDPNKKLCYIHLSAKKVDMNKVPPGNFVFLIDASGSMDMSNRLPLIKSAFRIFVNHLRPIDTVSIVTYGGSARIWLPPTSGADKLAILNAIESLEPDGDTPGASAIQLAYQMARTSFVKNGTNRVIIATDGDFNVGQQSEEELENLIEREKTAGIYLTCLGVGAGNLKDSKLQVMAKKGNGNYAYLDDVHEAEKIFVKELTQTIYVAADHASLSVKFNPDIVNAYRLIGFDNDMTFFGKNSNELEGGQVGSGATALVVYELETVPTDKSSLWATSPGQITVTYTAASDSTLKKEAYELSRQLIGDGQLNPDLRFVNAVTMLGLRLRNSFYSTKPTWKFILEYLKKNNFQSDYSKQELVRMIEKASKLYPDKKKKKQFLIF